MLFESLKSLHNLHKFDPYRFFFYIDACTDAQNEKTGETALTLASDGGFLKIIDYLIKAGADIDLGQLTALMIAAEKGHLRIVQYLLNSGANVQVQTCTGNTALMYACENGHTDIAKLLLQFNAELVC